MRFSLLAEIGGYNVCSSLQRKHTNYCNSLHLASGNLLPLPMENHPLSLCVLEKPFKDSSPFMECPAHTLQGHLQALSSGQHTQLYDVWVGCGNKQPNILPHLTHVSLGNICQMYIKHYCKSTEPRGRPCSARRDHRQSLLLQRFADRFDPFPLLIFVPIFIYFPYHKCLLKGVCSRVSKGNTSWLNLSLASGSGEGK